MFQRKKPRRDKIRTKEQKELLTILVVVSLLLVFLMVGLMWLFNGKR